MTKVLYKTEVLYETDKWQSINLWKEEKVLLIERQKTRKKKEHSIILGSTHLSNASWILTHCPPSTLEVRSIANYAVTI